MRYKVVIETRSKDGQMRAAVAEGPWFLKTAWATGGTSGMAFRGLCETIREEYPKHTFDFLHAEA